MYQVSYLEILGTRSTTGIHKYLEIQQEVGRSCVFTYFLTTKPGFWSVSSHVYASASKGREATLYIYNVDYCLEGW